MDQDWGPRENPADPRIYFAAERTLLAWVRTGLAMMGFGFVVARFGIFLRELAAVPGAVPLKHSGHTGLSLGVGTTLVFIGVAVNAAAAVKHWRTIQRLDRGQPLHFRAISLGTVAAFLLGLLGLLMAAYLLIGIDHAAPQPN